MAPGPFWEVTMYRVLKVIDRLGLAAGVAAVALVAAGGGAALASAPTLARSVRPCLTRFCRIVPESWSASIHMKRPGAEFVMGKSILPSLS